MSGLNSNYGISQNHNQTNQPVDSAMSLNTKLEHPTQGGMFKKKKFTEEIKTEFPTATLQKAPETEPNLAFTKSPRNQQFE